MANNGGDIIKQRRVAIVTFIKFKKTATHEVIQDFIAERFPQSSKLIILRDLDALVENEEVFKQGKAQSLIRRHHSIGQEYRDDWATRGWTKADGYSAIRPSDNG